MKVALIGYGKMGKAIHQILTDRGHEASLIIDLQNQDAFTAENLKTCDVAIEFTTPHTAQQNIETCIRAGVPVVSGSTGWMQHYPQVVELCKAENGSMLCASNFSVGVNIFFEINQLLAKLMNGHAAYDVTVDEIHHTAKKDAPSGTAITIAEQILANLNRKNSWVNAAAGEDTELAILSHRIDPAPGTHSVKYSSAIDDIEIIHTAHNRQGFALGAVLAAEYIWNKKGVFAMKDVLGL
jgi:4-hydroxy-tetrahydrodipicolinate reductase